MDTDMNCEKCDQPMVWLAGALVCANQNCTANHPTTASGTTILTFPPGRRSYSYEEACAVAKEWMRENYGPMARLNREGKDRYCEKLGLLVDFLWTLHPPDNPQTH